MTIVNKSRSALMAAVLASSFLVQSLPVFSATQFRDVMSSYWADNFIDYLSGQNVITGYPDNTFRPEKPVTRAEFATMLAKSQGLSTAPVANSSFYDIPANHWASGAVGAVAQRGWIAGYPGNLFRPNQPISMAEMYTIVSKVSGNQVDNSEVNDVLSHFNDAAQVPAWARTSVATAADMGIYVREVSPNMLMPNQQATRARVAATLAKLLNPTFRAGDVEVGEAVNVTGTLQATARPGEWAVTANNKTYIIADPSQFTGQSWFKNGAEVQLSGRLDPEASTNSRMVVKVNDLDATQVTENRVTVTGTLRPSATTQGAWVLETRDGDRYRILNPEQFSNNSWFGYGSTVELTGNTRSDVNLPSADGTAVVASNVKVTQAAQPTTLVGTLHKTVEPGGWYVQTASGQKYVLLDVESQKNLSWFQEGTEVEIKGNVRTDIPTIYMEGPVLKVSAITPDADQITGTQQVKLYYPNPLNLLRSPVLQLGDPVVRTIEGPNIPEKAVEAIIQGPVGSETIRGYFVDPSLQKLTVESVDVKNGTASVVLKAPAVDFKFDNESVTPSRLDAQVTQTLRQFAGVSDVDIFIRDPNNTTIWSDQN